jgi:hypothetical protein
VTVRRVAPLLLGAAAVFVIGAAFVLRAGSDQVAVGLVVDVDSAGLTDVRAFTLRGDDGAQTVYRIGGLENPAAFPPGHLVEHLGSGEPVRVVYHEENGERVATRIEDAPGG